MISVRIRLTPAGHYFFGGERAFVYDEKLKRQMSASYFISSLKMPTQTTLFGTLRYLIGVKDEKLRENSFDIVGDNEQFGMIKCISPVYLFKDGEYFIRTPFDHVCGEKNYKPFDIDSSAGIDSLSFPSDNVTKKKYPKNFNTKDGISKSYMSLSNQHIVLEDDIFTSSVEVVSRKSNKTPYNKDGFAKKEYVRLKEGWTFVFFAKLDCDQLPDYNKSVVMGKDSSVFIAEMELGEEPEVSELFRNKGKDFYYLQSPAYISKPTGDIIDNCSFCVLESETIRRFKTKNSKLQPEYGADLVQLISAGSVFYADDIKKLAMNMLL